MTSGCRLGHGRVYKPETLISSKKGRVEVNGARQLRCTELADGPSSTVTPDGIRRPYPPAGRFSTKPTRLLGLAGGPPCNAGTPPHLGLPHGEFIARPPEVELQNLRANLTKRRRCRSFCRRRTSPDRRKLYRRSSGPQHRPRTKHCWGPRLPGGNAPNRLAPRATP